MTDAAAVIANLFGLPVEDEVRPGPTRDVRVRIDGAEVTAAVAEGAPDPDPVALAEWVRTPAARAVVLRRVLPAGGRVFMPAVVPVFPAACPGLVDVRVARPQ